MKRKRNICPPHGAAGNPDSTAAGGTDGTACYTAACGESSAA
ncbi:hypothetical protein ACFSQ7_10200 [Paenibacillus rhizoplanae]